MFLLYLFVAFIRDIQYICLGYDLLPVPKSDLFLLHVRSLWFTTPHETLKFVSPVPTEGVPRLCDSIEESRADRRSFRRGVEVPYAGKGGIVPGTPVLPPGTNLDGSSLSSRPWDLAS